MYVLIAAHVHVAAGKKRQRACSGGAKADLARPVRGRTIALAGLRPFDQGDGKNVADHGSACAAGQRSIAIGRLIDGAIGHLLLRSEEHTSELQSLMRISYAVFCLKKKKQKKNQHTTSTQRTQNTTT